MNCNVGWKPNRRRERCITAAVGRHDGERDNGGIQ
jgi:hypothetical protein